MSDWPLSRLDTIPMTVDIDLLAEILGISRRTIERRLAARTFPIPRLRGEKEWTPAIEAKVKLLPEMLQAAMVEEACADFGIVTGTLATLIHVLRALMSALDTEERRLPERSTRQARMDMDHTKERLA